MLGLNASPETVAALRTELGLDAGRWRATSPGSAACSRRLRHLLHLPHAGGRHGARPPAGLAAAGADGAGALDRSSPFRSGIWAAARRGTAVDAGVMGVTQLGVAMPNFWFAMLLVLVFAVKLRWVSAGGFPGWEAGLAAGPQGADPAGGGAGAAAGLDPGARHALGADRHARRGLHPHRPRQGPDPRPGAAAARAAQRADPGADHHRPAVLLPARRRHHHRERLLPARPRAAGLPGDQPARPHRGAERGDAARRRGHPRHLPRRPRLRRGRPAAAAAR